MTKEYLIRQFSNFYDEVIKGKFANIKDLGNKVFVGTDMQAAIINGIFIHTNGNYYSSSDWKIAVAEVNDGDVIRLGSRIYSYTASQVTKYRYAFYDTVVTADNYTSIMTPQHLVGIAPTDGGKDNGQAVDMFYWDEVLEVPNGAKCVVISYPKKEQFIDYRIITYDYADKSCISVGAISGITSDLLISFKDLGVTKNTHLDIVSKYSGSNRPTVVGKTSLFTSMAYPIGDSGFYKRNTLRFPYELRGEANTITITVPSGTIMDIKELSVRFEDEKPKSYGAIMKCHNGVNRMVPQNTTPSFEWAGKLGYPRIITQFQVTSDNVIVCCHNTTINQYAKNMDGTNLAETVTIADHTYAELCNYDYGLSKSGTGGYFAKTKLPTMEDFLDICSAYGMAPEFSMHTGNIGADNWVKFKKMLSERNLLDKTVFKSFDGSVLQYAYDVFGDTVEGYGIDVNSSSTISSKIADFETVIGQSFSKKKFVEIPRSFVNAENVSSIRQQGYICAVWDIGGNWTVDDYVNAISYGVSEFTDDWNCQQGMLWK